MVPFATTLINFVISNVTFLSRDWVYVFDVGLIYAIINYLISRAFNRPVYSIVDWNDYRAFLVVGIMLLVAVVLHVLFTKVSHLMRKGKKQEELGIRGLVTCNNISFGVGLGIVWNCRQGF